MGILPSYGLQYQAYNSLSINSSICKAKRKLECSFSFTYKTIQFVLEHRFEDCFLKKNIYIKGINSASVKILPCLSSNLFKEKLSSFIENKIERDKYFTMGSRSHSIPCRSPSNQKIHNRRPWCHSPCHTGSYSHPPPRPRSNSSTLPTCRCHRTLVPEQCYRGWEIHRTSKPGYSEHSNLHMQ